MKDLFNIIDQHSHDLRNSYQLKLRATPDDLLLLLLLLLFKKTITIVTKTISKISMREISMQYTI